jgi:hypothetical protein
LFALLCAGFIGLAAWAAAERQWIITAAAGALGLWMADLAFRSLR